jgi:hypothetical protein
MKIFDKMFYLVKYYVYIYTMNTFTRGLDPKEAMNIGLSKFEKVKIKAKKLFPIGTKFVSTVGSVDIVMSDLYTEKYYFDKKIYVHGENNSTRIIYDEDGEKWAKLIEK